MFRVSTLDMENLALTKAKLTSTRDFFGKETFLTVSGQLNAEAYACTKQGLHVRSYVPCWKLKHKPPPSWVLDGWAWSGVCRPWRCMKLARERSKYVFAAVLENAAMTLSSSLLASTKRNDHSSGAIRRRWFRTSWLLTHNPNPTRLW